MCSSTTVVKLVKRQCRSSPGIRQLLANNKWKRGGSHGRSYSIQHLVSPLSQLSLGLCPSKSNLGWLLREMDNAVLFFPPCFLGCQEDGAAQTHMGAHAYTHTINKTMTHCSLETMNVWAMRRSAEGELLLWRHKQHGKNTKACQLAPRQSTFSITISVLT